MKKREIKFNALYIAGPNEEIKIIIKGVSVYPEGNFGCSDDKFIAALMNTDYYMDPGTGQFIKKGDESCESNFDCNLLFDHNDWVWFDGLPLMGSEYFDSKGVQIFEGDILITDLGHRNVIETVSFEKGCFVCKQVGFDYSKHRSNPDTLGDTLSASYTKYDIIGNLYINPELLKESEEDDK